MVVLLSAEFNVMGFVQPCCSVLEGGGSGTAGYQVPQALSLLLQRVHQGKLVSYHLVHIRRYLRRHAIMYFRSSR